MPSDIERWMRKPNSNELGGKQKHGPPMELKISGAVRHCGKVRGGTQEKGRWAGSRAYNTGKTLSGTVVR
jgi:hypothetical protein